MDETGSEREDDWFRENEKELLEEARVAREKREAERAAQEEAGRARARSRSCTT